MPGSRKHPLILWSPGASRDIIRLREFIAVHAPNSARRAVESLHKGTKLLQTFPGAGHKIEGRHDRELFIPFGNRGYILRYRLDNDTIVILKVWHGHENIG